MEITARSGPPDDMLVAKRILEQPLTYRRWETEHDRLMRTVSEQARLPRQVVALRSTAFTLIHRKALFEYLRNRQVVGSRRHRLLALFYGYCDYAASIVAEHGNYVRGNSSYFCTQFLGEQLMRDAAFLEPLQLYEEWYNEYFRIFCDVALANTEEEKQAVAPLEALKPFLKHRLAEARREILTLPQKPGSRWREVEIRKASGDTVRLSFAGNVLEFVARRNRRT